MILTFSVLQSLGGSYRNHFVHCMHVPDELDNSIDYNGLCHHVVSVHCLQKAWSVFDRIVPN